MHRFFIAEPFAQEMKITGLDAKHIIKVLRMPVGEKIQIVSSDHVNALMEISALTADAAFLRFVEPILASNEPSIELILVQGLPKGDKMDYIVQKATELGVSKIIVLAMERSIVKLDNSKAEKKQQRWQKIAMEAAKQSKRDIIPKIEYASSLKKLMEYYTGKIILAYEEENTNSLKHALTKDRETRRIMVIIGPEGGLTTEEVGLAKNKGAEIITLGKRILRTETAGIAVLSAVLYETDNLGGCE